MKKSILIYLLLLPFLLPGQQHGISDSYIAPEDPLVLKKLQDWENLKFGLLMHWGTYSQWGIVESWSICPEDEGWTKRNPKYGDSYFEYLKNYENLQTTFNPVLFDPDKWANAAAGAGMKYMVFTTKHHDGFSMFDTQLTDYKITDVKTPFHTHPKANITKEVFDSFRKKDFMIGAYFSKPDWHSEYYWWPNFPPFNRNINYDNEKYPERWQAFKDFTYGQIKELVTGYGSVDIMWLDGGWVRPKERKVVYDNGKEGIQYNQDIDMAGIAKMARSYQSGLLFVDRTVAGEYENYQTPEQTIPDQVLFHPWESCITLGRSWSYVPGDHYKSDNTVIHTLLKIISRGGSLLLNVGPSPKGDWDPVVYDRLKEIGEWMNENGEAVYDTRILTPYEKEGLYYMHSVKDGSKFIYLVSETDEEEVHIPEVVKVDRSVLTNSSKVSVVSGDVKVRKFDSEKGEIYISAKEKAKIPFTKYAVVFRIEN